MKKLKTHVTIWTKKNVYIKKKMKQKDNSLKIFIMNIFFDKAIQKY